MGRDLGSIPRPVLAALAAAERLLTRRAGATVILTDPEDLGGSERSVVARARVERSPFELPRTLVVKHHTGEPAPGRPDPFPFEVASCQLFTALPAAVRPSPAIIAHDAQAKLIVMEDLGRAATVADALFDSDPERARRCLLSWARALGRMQAATAGRENDFGALLRRLGERTRRDPIADDARAALAELPGLLTALLGVEVPAAAEREVRGTARLLGSTRFRAFSPSDTCPDNSVIAPEGVRFVDFEWGCFRDIALDAAYLKLPFPGCESSFAVPDGVADAMLLAWHNEIAAVWPDLDDPAVLERRLLDAQLLWVWLSTWWLLPRMHRGDELIGDDPVRSPRISSALTDYWRRLRVAAEQGGRAATADLADTVVTALVKAANDASLPLYPAFREPPHVRRPGHPPARRSRPVSRHGWVC